MRSALLLQRSATQLGSLGIRPWLCRAFADVPAQTFTGLNIYKAGSEPVAGPDEDYPSWVADLAQAPPKLTELRRAWKAQPATDDLEVDALDKDLLEKIVRFENRAKIRATNSAAGTFGGL